MNKERRKTDRRVPPAVMEFAIEQLAPAVVQIAAPGQEGSDAQIAFWAGYEAARLDQGSSNIRAAWNDFKGSEQFNRLNSSPVSAGESFQSRVMPWLLECFGETIAGDTVERNHRFLEEALELVQSCGCTSDEARKLVDYVYGRPVGEKSQEVGGVMVTLAALCLAQGLDMHLAAETELARITQPAMVERIREKQKRKPAMSPLPGSYPERAALSAPSHGEQVRVLGHDGWRQAVDNVSAYAHLYNSGFGIIHEIRAEYARLIAASPSPASQEQG